MAVDTSEVAKLDVEPGTLPETMAAWVIREERQGEPKDAFQLEQIEVPEPGAFEVIVRVMAAGVNFNNVWAALGKPVSVFRYHPEKDERPFCPLQLTSDPLWLGVVAAPSVNALRRRACS